MLGARRRGRQKAAAEATPTAVPLHIRFGKPPAESRTLDVPLAVPWTITSQGTNPLLPLLKSESSSSHSDKSFFFLDQREEWADGSEKSHLLLLKGTDTIPIPATREALIFLLLGSSRPIPCK
jgi:hypothetical protein